MSNSEVNEREFDKEIARAVEREREYMKVSRVIREIAPGIMEVLQIQRVERSAIGLTVIVR